MKTSHLTLKNAQQNKDSAAWEKLAQVYPPLISNWLRQLGIDESDVGDLTQEVLFALVASLGEFEHNGRTGAFRAWLRRITINRCRRFWNEKKKRPVQLESLDELADPDSNASKTWDRVHNEFIVQRILELIRPKFTEKTFLTFVRSAIHGEPAKDIANDLGISIAQVYKFKFRVMQKLIAESKYFLDQNEDADVLSQICNSPHIKPPASGVNGVQHAE